MAGLTLNELASRLLHKLQVLDRAEAAAGADLDKAIEKLRAAHGVFKSEGLVQWTLQDIPEDVEEGYLMMAAALGADDFAAAAPNAAWPQMAMRILQAYVHVPRSGPREIVDY
jgi:hypothetical protein